MLKTHCFPAQVLCSQRISHKSIEIGEEIKRWSARRKLALVLDIIQGKTTVSEASRQFDLPLSAIESWIDQARSGMENALKAKPEDMRERSTSRSLREVDPHFRTVG